MPVQRTVFTTRADMWKAIKSGVKTSAINKIIGKDPALAQAYADLKTFLPHMDFQYVAGQQPEADMIPDNAGIYTINYGRRNELNGIYNDPTRYVGAILHEMMHITAALQYFTNVQPGSPGHASNMHLPVGQGTPAKDDFGLTGNQLDDPNQGAVVQIEAMFANWQKLVELSEDDVNKALLTDEQAGVIVERFNYAKQMPGMLAHYDTVLIDLLYYLRTEKAQNSQSYQFAQQMLAEANARRSSGTGAVQNLSG